MWVFIGKLHSLFHLKALESELQRMAQEAEFMKEQEEEARIVLAAARAVSHNCEVNLFFSFCFGMIMTQHFDNIFQFVCPPGRSGVPPVQIFKQGLFGKINELRSNL